MARDFIGMNVDTSEGNQLAGFLKEVSLKIGTPMHIGPVLKYVHSVYSEEFIMHMAALAPIQAERFHHVYEWNQIGVPKARLWRDVLRGSGNSRTATFEWRASKSIVPVRDDFQEKGVKQIHVFVWKAPVMEYSQDITISPKRGTRLAYFTGPVYSDPERYEMRFTQPGETLNVTDPGGPHVKGAFTAEYIRWWANSSGGASATFESKVRRVLQKNTEEIMDAGLTKGGRNRTRTFGLKVHASESQAQAAGKAAAAQALRRASHNYIEQANTRERLIYGD